MNMLGTKKGKGKLGYTLAYIPLLGSMSIAIGYAIISALGFLRTFWSSRYRKDIRS